MASESKVGLKLLIDKNRNKVLFAEAGKDFVDFLFNLMSIPIGTVTRLLTKNSMVGSLGNLYGSIENLSDNYLQTEETKEYLLKPKLPSAALQVPFLLPNEDAKPKSKKVYQCNTLCEFYTDHPQTECPSCEEVMDVVLSYVTPTPQVGVSAKTDTTRSDGGGFVRGVVTFMVTDDLVVTPSAAISSITKVISEVGVQGLEQVEERVVYLGMDQGLMLLKESLQSKTVLSNVFLRQQQQPVSGTKTNTSSKKKNKKRKLH